MTRQRMRERGFALLIVLWALGGLALLGTTVTGMGRREAQAGIAGRAAEAAHAAAEAALYRTMFDLLTGRRTVDGALLPVEAGGAMARVLVSSEDGKVNPNTAPAELLAALLQAVGADPPRAGAVAAAIVRWRGGGTVQAGSSAAAALAPYRAAGLRWGPPGHPFRSVDELSLVLGMGPALYAALVPHVSVFPDGILDQAGADPVVRRALQAAGIALVTPDEGPARGPSVVAIDARVELGGGTARIVAAVRLDPADPQRPAAILSWREPGRAD